MIPSAFKISVTGDGQSPVPVKITIGPGVLFVCIGFMLVVAMRAKK